MPDGPDPTDQQDWGENDLEDSDEEGAAVPAAAVVAVGLKHGSDAGEEDVEQQDDARP